MKKLILILALLLSTIPELCAQSQDTTYLLEEFLLQSETQKKTGLIMLGAGLGAEVLGTLMIGIAFSGGSEAVGVGGLVFFSAGAISTLASIPVIISSASNARKAGQLSLEMNSARVIAPNGSALHTYPALKISVPLNSAKR